MALVSVATYTFEFSIRPICPRLIKRAIDRYRRPDSNTREFGIEVSRSATRGRSLDSFQGNANSGHLARMPEIAGSSIAGIGSCFAATRGGRDRRNDDRFEGFVAWDIIKDRTASYESAVRDRLGDAAQFALAPVCGEQRCGLAAGLHSPRATGMRPEFLFSTRWCESPTTTGLFMRTSGNSRSIRQQWITVSRAPALRRAGPVGMRGANGRAVATACPREEGRVSSSADNKANRQDVGTRTRLREDKLHQPRRGGRPIECSEKSVRRVFLYTLRCNLIYSTLWLGVRSSPWQESNRLQRASRRQGRSLSQGARRLLRVSPGSQRCRW